MEVLDDEGSGSDGSKGPRMSRKRSSAPSSSTALLPADEKRIQRSALIASLMLLC